MNTQRTTEKLALKDMLADVYNTYEGSEEWSAYSERHGIESAGILTITDDQTAALAALSLAPLIE